MSIPMSMSIRTRLVGGTVRATIGSANESYLGDKSDEPFGDTSAMRQRFRDPRYATSASFRELVAQEIAASATVEATTPGEGVNGHHQVAPRSTSDEPGPPDYSDEHSQAMIARAEKAGL